MRSIARLTMSVAAVAISLIATTAAHADVVINITQSGSDVLLTSSGTFDESLATFLLTATPQEALNPAGGFAVFGTHDTVNVYSLTGPTSFGVGVGASVTNNSGTESGVSGYNNIFGISSSYVSNSYFSGSGTISNATFASLGLTPGTYNYLVGQNVVTLNIGSVPEPATWSMMLLGFGGIGFAMRRYRCGLKLA